MLKKFIKYVSQNMLGMVGMSVYILADTYFISVAVGADGITALNLVLPIYNIIFAIGAMMGVGSAIRFVVERNKKSPDADGYFFHALVWAFIISLFFIFVGLFLPDKLIALLGGDAQIVATGKNYTRIFMCFAPFFMWNYICNAFVRNDGNPSIAMSATLFSSLFNIVFDYILMFPLGLSMEGAALATVLSQAVGAIWILRFLSGKKTILHLRKENFKLQKEILLPCLALGISTFVMLSTESILSISFTSSLSRYGGDLAVGAMTIITSVSQLATLPLQGICQGGQPIMSYNFGAGNRDRVKKAFFTQFTACTVFTGCFWLIMLLFPKGFAGIFSNNTELITYTAWALRIYMAGIFSLGFQVACQQSFMALGQAKVSLLLACLRKLILLIPLIFILPHFIQNKVFAVFLAEPISDILAAAITTATFFHRFHKILVCHTALVHEPETP